jgi:methylmalonyl-CoA mutase, C-terminal domain
VEVIYTGLHQTPEQIVRTAIQEDANAIGLSVLSGAHLSLFRRVIELPREEHATDIVVFGGGIIAPDDISELIDMGVARIFTPGATTHEIVDWAPPSPHPFQCDRGCRTDEPNSPGHPAAPWPRHAPDADGPRSSA